MISLQGICAKELKKQGKLPEKFNDLACEPSKKNVGQLIRSAKTGDVGAFVNVNFDGNHDICRKYAYYLCMWNYSSKTATGCHRTAVDPSKDWQLSFKVNAQGYGVYDEYWNLVTIHSPNGSSQAKFPSIGVVPGGLYMGKGIGVSYSNLGYNKRIAIVEEDYGDPLGMYTIKVAHKSSNHTISVYSAYEDEEFSLLQTVTVSPATTELGAGYNYISIQLGHTSTSITDYTCYLRDIEFISDGEIVFQRV